MSVGSGILGPDVRFEDRLIPSLEEMERRITRSMSLYWVLGRRSAKGR